MGVSSCRKVRSSLAESSSPQFAHHATIQTQVDHNYSELKIKTLQNSDDKNNNSKDCNNKNDSNNSNGNKCCATPINHHAECTPTLAIDTRTTKPWLLLFTRGRVTFAIWPKPFTTQQMTDRLHCVDATMRRVEYLQPSKMVISLDQRDVLSEHQSSQNKKYDDWSKHRTHEMNDDVRNDCNHWNIKDSSLAKKSAIATAMAESNN